MNKKFILSICIVLLAGSLFAGCVNEPVENPGHTLTPTEAMTPTVEPTTAPTQDGAPTGQATPDIQFTTEPTEEDSTMTPIPDDTSDSASDSTLTPEPTPGTEPTESSAASTATGSATSTATNPAKTPAPSATPEHTHQFTKATCTKAAVCKLCGKTQGKALGHTASAATCTKASVCTRCGKTVKAALGHNYKAATCTAPSTCSRCGATKGEALGHSYSQGKCKRCKKTGGPLTPEQAKLFHNKLTDEQNAQALKVAQQIADSIPEGLTDCERVNRAAQAVRSYYERCTYTMEGNEYSQAYGVFISGVSSCAGTCRALGLVLSCMHYSWTHVNENQYCHQWIELEMDGRKGWAESQLGYAGYYDE